MVIGESRLHYYIVVKSGVIGVESIRRGRVKTKKLRSTRGKMAETKRLNFFWIVKVFGVQENFTLH